MCCWFYHWVEAQTQGLTGETCPALLPQSRSKVFRSWTYWSVITLKNHCWTLTNNQIQERPQHVILKTIFAPLFGLETEKGNGWPLCPLSVSLCQEHTVSRASCVQGIGRLTCIHISLWLSRLTQIAKLGFKASEWIPAIILAPPLLLATLPPQLGTNYQWPRLLSST